MKKLIAVLLVAVLAFAFAACGGKTKEEPATGAEPASNAAQPATDAAAALTEEASQADLVIDASNIMTHEEFLAAPMQSPVTVETYVQAKQSWWEGKGTFYTQAKDGAYFLYEMPCTQEEYDLLTEGTQIIVTGYKAEWSGEIEITEAKFEIVEDGDTYIADATDVTAMLGTDELAAHMNEKVSFKGMTVEASKDGNGNEAAFLYKYDGSGQDGDDLYFQVSKDGQTYTFTVESYLTGAGTDVYEAVKALKVGDVIDMDGFLYWYNGANPHITAVSAAA